MENSVMGKFQQMKNSTLVEREREAYPYPGFKRSTGAFSTVVERSSDGISGTNNTGLDQSDSFELDMKDTRNGEDMSTDNNTGGGVLGLLNEFYKQVEPNSAHKI